MADQSNQIMIKIIITLLFLVSLSCTSAIRQKPAEKHIDAVVEGVVMCQRCHLNRTSSLKDATPVSGATISVSCKDQVKKQSFFKAFAADENGYFYAKLDGFKMGNSLLEHPLQACSVKLVKSAQFSCNVTTNINYGVKGLGAPLRYLKKRVVRSAYEAVIYTAGPLAFRPARCMENQY